MLSPNSTFDFGSSRFLGVGGWFLAVFRLRFAVRFVLNTIQARWISWCRPALQLHSASSNCAEAGIQHFTWKAGQ